jgi:hypothetical protein
MSKMRSTVLIAICSIISATAAPEVALSGTIKDAKGCVIAEASVSLASNSSIKGTSNAKGEFALGKATAIHGRGVWETSASPVNGIVSKGNTLRFFMASPCENGAVSIHSGNGKKLYSLSLGKMSAGLHTTALPELPDGFYVLHIAVDRSAATWKIVKTGSEICAASGSLRATGASRVTLTAATGGVDTLIVQRDAYKTAKKTISSFNQTGIAVVLEVIPVKDLPAIKEMPDPLTMKDGTKVTTPDQWKLRRREMMRILEDYEYGHMPPPPGNVKATVATASTRVTISNKQVDYRMMRLTFGPNEKCGFDLGIFTPADSTGSAKRYPVLVYVTMGSGKTSANDASAAITRGYAVATINYSQMGADATSWNKSAFFPSYPEYDWRDFSAWAWGISRAVDYLVTDPAIDGEKIMTTGVSRCGQPVLLAGAFDERIALAAPVAGGMAMRYSGKEMGGGRGQGITEVVDQGTYWFGPRFEEFRNQTPKLPCDQHWLIALTAPRLSIMCNSYADQYGRAYAAVQTYVYAKPVYTFLKADENVGLNFREGSHGMTAEDWSALMDFADQKMLKKPGTRKFDVIPPADKTP